MDGVLKRPMAGCISNTETSTHQSQVLDACLTNAEPDWSRAWCPAVMTPNLPPKCCNGWNCVSQMKPARQMTPCHHCYEWQDAELRTSHRVASTRYCISRNRRRVARDYKLSVRIHIKSDGGPYLALFCDRNPDGLWLFCARNPGVKLAPAFPYGLGARSG
jgi:hypothetical protein